MKHRGYVSGGGGEVIETSRVWVCRVCVCGGGGGSIKTLKHRGYQSWGWGVEVAVETSWCQSQERGTETSWVEMKSAK